MWKIFFLELLASKKLFENKLPNFLVQKIVLFLFINGFQVDSFDVK